MNRRTHSKNEALQKIGPHLATLKECYRKAWGDWVQLRSTHLAQGRSLSPTLRARVIYEYVTHHARRAFANVNGVSVKERGFLTVTFGNAIVLRFKKLKNNLTMSGIPTRQLSLFEAQGELPGLPPEATLLVAGYLLDPTGTEITRLVIVCRDEAGLIWCHELDDAALGNVQPIPAAATAPILPRLRSKIRKQSKRHEGA